MKGRLFLDVVVGKSSAVLELFSSEDKTLLVWRDTFFVLNLGLDVLNSVRGFDLKGDGLSGESLDKNLHSSSKPEHKMEGRLFLDVVIGKGSAIFQLFSSENETLLIWGNSFLILDLSLNIFDGIGRLYLEGDGFSGQSLDKDLHTTAKSED